MRTPVSTQDSLHTSSRTSQHACTVYFGFRPKRREHFISPGQMFFIIALTLLYCTCLFVVFFFFYTSLHFCLILSSVLERGVGPSHSVKFGFFLAVLFAIFKNQQTPTEILCVNELIRGALTSLYGR